MGKGEYNVIFSLSEVPVYSYLSESSFLTSICSGRRLLSTLAARRWLATNKHAQVTPAITTGLGP